VIFRSIYNAVDIMAKSSVQINSYLGAILIGVARFIACPLMTDISRKFGQ